jgi:hypothetical protein
MSFEYSAALRECHLTRGPSHLKPRPTPHAAAPQAAVPPHRCAVCDEQGAVLHAVGQHVQMRPVRLSLRGQGGEGGFGCAPSGD